MESQNCSFGSQKMMSMIIFKNIYPHHFANLQNESGIVKTAFSDKESFVERKQSELEKQIQEKERLLYNIDNDVLNDVREVKCVMLAELAEWNGSAYKISTGHYSGDFLDASTIMNHIVGIHTINGIYTDAADTNHDGMISVADATAVMSQVVGIDIVSQK